MIEQLAHITGKDENEIRDSVLVAAIFFGALIIALIFLGLWVAIVMYGIVPLSIDGGAEIKIIRVSLILGGGVAIVGAYLIGLYAAMSS